MTSIKIETYQYLKEFPKVHVKITDDLFNKIKANIRAKYRSLYRYNDKLQIKYVTLKKEFRFNQNHNFDRISKISEDANIKPEEFVDNILGFYYQGSHNRYVEIPRYIDTDEFFVEGYALYLAEGDNGSNGLTRPRKFRFTNSDIKVIEHMIKWLDKYFPDIEKYLLVIKPLNYEGEILGEHSIPFRITQDKYNKIVKYRLCADNAVLIDLILSIEQTIKDICAKDKKLAQGYIRGMMIGEGTVYNNRSRYVRIEMRNSKEIEYMHRLFLMLGYDCKTSCRTTRENMWSIYIGAKQLQKYHDEIGFGVHEKRQKILEEATKVVVKGYESCFLESELRPEYVDKIKKIEKEKFSKYNFIKTLRNEIEKDHHDTIYK